MTEKICVRTYSFDCLDRLRVKSPPYLLDLIMFIERNLCTLFFIFLRI